jgi:membrane associated rhomboid family serine protease
MFQSILDDVKREFQYGNMVTRIIIANCIVFIIVNIANLVLHIPTKENDTLYDGLVRFFSMPRDGWYFLTHPWTIFTSGFMHEGFFHILWNMLAFYWFGRIVGDLLGNHRILPLYIGSVIFGNIVFFLAFNLTPYGNFPTDLPLETINFLKLNQHALGASGAVMCMLASAAYVAPDYIFNVLLIGPVKLKFIALVVFFLDLIGIANQENTGGHFAHLGGAAFGILYASQLRNNIDLVRPISIIIDFFTDLIDKFKKGNKSKKNTFKFERNEKAYAKTEKTSQNTANKGTRRPNTEGVSDQEKLDTILDKIKQKGYESLSAEEKEFLFKVSKK